MCFFKIFSMWFLTIHSQCGSLQYILNGEQVQVEHISRLHLLFPPTSNALQCKVRTNHKRLTSYKNTTSFFINFVFFFSSISQTSPRGRLESLDSGVEGMECSDRMDDLNRMDDLLPDLGLLTSHDCSLGNPGPNDPPAGQYSTRTSIDEHLA